jgi:hypothetical protein
MHGAILISTLLLGTPGQVGAATVVQDIRPVSTADTILAAFTTEGWVKESTGPRLIVAVWSDGFAVWSDDRLRGGSPYRSGSIPPQRLKGVLAALKEKGFFDQPNLDLLHKGYDSASTVLLAHDGNAKIRMESWHELYEADGKRVATSRGMRALYGQSMLEVLRREPADYLYYRLAWGELRKGIDSLNDIPGKSIKGSLFYDAGEVYWKGERGTAP